MEMYKSTQVTLKLKSFFSKSIPVDLHSLLISSGVSPDIGFPSSATLALKDTIAAASRFSASGPWGSESYSISCTSPSRYKAWLLQGCTVTNRWQVWKVIFVVLLLTSLVIHIYLQLRVVFSLLGLGGGREGWYWSYLLTVNCRHGDRGCIRSKL